MAFRFHEASCVLAGTFNIYIIRPDWLGAVKLLLPGSEVRIESQLSQPGFRLTSPGLRSRWIVEPTRIILETDRSDENCGATADRLLESLPWTPLVGLGCNFAYRGTAADVDGWPTKTSFPSTQIPEGTSLKQRTWHLGVERGDQIFNLQMSEVDDYVEIRANVHTDLQGHDIDFARAAAQQFFQHRQTAETFIRDLFKAGIEDAIVNH